MRGAIAAESESLSRSTTIYVVRHGETSWNKTHTLQGQTDVDLNDVGASQANQCQEYFSRIQTIDAIYSSDLKRALKTAETIAEAKNISVKTDQRLRELSFGCFEGFSIAEIKKKYPIEWSNWRSIPDYKVPRGEHGRTGESSTELTERVVNIFEELAKNHVNETIVVVCHGGVLRTWTYSIGLGRVKFPNACISKIRGTPVPLDGGDVSFRWVAETVADTKHLQKIGYIDTDKLSSTEV